MEKKLSKLVPYSVYLPQEYYDKIRDFAKERKASSMVREAICMLVDGSDAYRAGYNNGIKEAYKITMQMAGISDFSYRGKVINEYVAEQIKKLEV